MRIVHLEAGRHLYGGSRQVGYLLEALAARAIDNVLVCAAGNPLAQTPAARVFEWRLSGDLDATLGRRLERLMRELRPDLLHVHSRRGADLFGGRSARSAGVPAVLTRRVQSAEPAVWMRWKCRPYRRIAVISAAVRAEMEGFGIPRERLLTIPSAVDSGRFKPDPTARAALLERYRLPEDALILGQAAQLIRRKGHDFSLALVERLASAMPRTRLLLFGRGPAQPRLARAVARRGLQDIVRFCGYEPDWPRLVPGLDLLLHPAEREGLGAAVLEAMSAAVPVAAASVGGIVDVIDDGQDGRLLPLEISVWAQAVGTLLADPALRRAIGAAARRKVERRYTIERMAADYVSLYREVLRDAGT